MKKIRLDLEALKVESFVTSDYGARGEGTVFAMAWSDCHATCGGGQTCNGDEGCDMSAPEQCGDYTNPQLQSCTGGDPSQLTCGPPDPTQFRCTEMWCTDTENIEECDGDPEFGGNG